MNEGFRNRTGEILLCFDADYSPKKILLRNLPGNLLTPKSAQYREESWY